MLKHVASSRSFPDAPASYAELEAGMLRVCQSRCGILGDDRNPSQAWTNQRQELPVAWAAQSLQEPAWCVRADLPLQDLVKYIDARTLSGLPTIMTKGRTIRVALASLANICPLVKLQCFTLTGEQLQEAS